MITPQSISPRFAVIVVGLALAFVWYLWPLVHFDQNMASKPGDPFAHVALAGSFCRIITSQDNFTQSLFYPNGVHLAYDGPLLHLLVCPFSSLGPVAMFNLIAVLQVVLIFTASYLLAKRYLTSKLVIISFTLLYSFSGFYLARSEQHLHLLSTIWAVPAAILLFDQLQLIRFRSVLIFSLGTAAILLSAWQNLPNLTVLYLFLGLSKLLQITRRHLALSIRHLLFGSIIFTAVLIPFIRPMWQHLSNRQQIDSYQTAAVYNADLLSYLIPHPSHPLYPLFNSIDTAIRSSRRPSGELINPIDILVLALITYALIRHRRQWRRICQDPLIITAIITFILSLGPYLSIKGIQIIDLLPIASLYDFPPFSLTRTPIRLGIVVVCIATLTALTFFDKLNNIYSGRLKVILLIYSLLVTIILPANFHFPHFKYQNSLPMFALDQMAQDHRPITVLHLPTAIGADPTQNFLQLYHGHPLLTGYISYASITPQTYSHIATDPFLSRLGCSRHQFPYSKDAADILSQPGLVYDQLAGSNVGYIIVNKMILGEDHCQDLQIYYYNEVKNYPFLKTLEQSTVFDIYRIE